jgi:oligogalacturonide transport system substrate-binding protein
MKSWKKVWALILSTVMAISLLAGCGSSQSPTPTVPATGQATDTPTQTPTQTPAATTTESTSAGDEKITLRFSWWGGDARHEATLAVIDAFMKKYPNIKIEPEYGAQDGYNDKKTTEFSTKTAPDIFQIETGSGPEYCRMGVLYNLSSLKNIKFDKFDANFIKVNGQFGTGSQYAIPTGVAGSALIVNKTLADKIGIDLTQQYDWEKLIEWGKLVQAYDPECYLLSVNTSCGVSFFIRTYARQLIGLPIIDDANKTLNMTEEQFTQCFDLIDRLYKSKTCAPAAYKAPYHPNKDQEDPNWINGKYVASVGYTSNALVLQEANPNVEYIAGCMPLLPDRKSDGWVNNCPQYMGIYAETKHPEEAALFLDFFFNSEEAAGLLGTVRSVPPTAFAQKIVAENGSLDKLTAEAVERSLSYSGFDDGGLTTSTEATKILEEAYEVVSYGTMTPAEAAKDVVEKLNSFLATQ